MATTERERPARGGDKTHVTPNPADPEFFRWLERLFEGNDQKPERIELRQVYGPGLRKQGAKIDQKEWKLNAPKPTREQLVSSSNELLAQAQNNCNVIGKPHKYGVFAWHYAKGDAPYSSYVLALRPKQREGYDAAEGTDEDDFDAFFGDEEGVPPDRKRRDSLLHMMLEHAKQNDENERWRQDQFSTATGDVIGFYQKLITAMMTERQIYNDHQIKSFERQAQLFMIAEEALSKKAERELAAEKERHRQHLISQGVDFLKQMVPVAVNQLTGKKTIPTDATPESIAVKSFIEGLSEAQGIAIFGPIEQQQLEDGSVANQIKGGGLFSAEQVKIFFEVANCVQPIEAIDQFLEGPNAITGEQMTKAQEILNPQQIMPLVAIVMDRQKKKAAQSGK